MESTDPTQHENRFTTVRRMHNTNWRLLMRAVVKMTGADPKDLRKMCQEYCDSEMIGEEIAKSDAECDALANDLLLGFLAEIGNDTVGVDRLFVSVLMD